MRNIIGESTGFRVHRDDNYFGNFLTYIKSKPKIINTH